MVSILLMFTRAQRGGLWDLHLFLFRCMLPYLMRCDHTNYARWGTRYLSEMYKLPNQVLVEFKRGNFVVKRSAAKFNQVSPDQGQEWLNSTGKTGGGIVGITKTPSALSRCALSYNLRSHIAADTSIMFDVHMDDSIVHKEGSKSRQKQDNDAYNKYIPVNKVFENFPQGAERALLQFHATTGSDTTSYICGHSKMTAWKVFEENFELLLSLGDGDLATETIKCAEVFICKLYKVSVESVDKVRFPLFAKMGTPEKLPPTTDAFKYHVMRSHFQTMVWRQAINPIQSLPKPEDIGWRIDGDQPVPFLMSLDSILQACLEMIRCQCCTGCAANVESQILYVLNCVAATKTDTFPASINNTEVVKQLKAMTPKRSCFSKAISLLKISTA